MADFADLAAATAAGYKEIVSQSGGSFLVTLEKYLSGAPGASGGPLRAYGVGATQAAAEAQAVVALNAQRRHRYAGTSSIPQDGNSFSGSLWASAPGGTPLSPDAN